MSVLEPHSGEKILDIGAGKGEKAAKVLESSQGIEVFAVDPDERRVAEAKRDHPAVKSFVAGAEKLPFGDAYFDKAYSTLALHHFANLDQALAEISRVLKPGGVYVIFEVEPSSLQGRLFRFFGRLMGERMSIMTEAQCIDKVGAADGLVVAGSTRLAGKYLIQLKRQ
jgi:ubiquinone/menaquinone biosynthesis C-methylase UbiE